MVALKVLKAANSVKGFVTSVGEPPLDEDGFVEGEDTDEFHNKVQPSIMDLLGLGGLAASITTMVLTEGHVVDAASYTTSVLAPYSIYQKHHLQKLGGMRGQQNMLRKHVNRLSSENEILEKNIDALTTQVDKLEGVEKTLEEIAKDGQSSVDRLVKIVKRTKEIQAAMKKNLERKMMSILLGILLESDRDKNFVYSPMEIQMMCMRLKMVQGIHFNEENFRKLLPSDPRESVELNDVIKVVWNLKDPTIPDEKRVFLIVPDDLVKT
mmetsp:Transcript_12637/g.18573  ORF Transcript_12637/g.18573 Transcript_12637/m.18573 type:complete len:267 (-) Transcript_12637:219-1019(-)|eukprot:CAMPEP_0194211186 /NCGR_PEP_ID=MMETSP0156-20130528/9780_1 /TAXON_ID=33649 /ORGANISM="Thalassionema nitzschioides, Strain L26-B" /LENGTH=266 /DNA_ID=CAMNT_0038938677 /DNA_START=64 /DNA_END=864 /DNA_ORIENTATION=-